MAGFSLVELMVAVGIVGVLATLAVPRYHQFMVQARRGEAKSNLSHLATLQEVYKVEHYAYYQGGAMTGINGVGYKDGKGNDGLCNDPLIDVDQGLGNYLGFRPNGCSELRYFYQFNAGGDAVASAASDADTKHIYPDCNGYATCEECGYKFGDALTLPMGGKIKVCRNITKYCPDGGPCTTNIPPCPASCPSGQVMHPAPRCCQPITCPASCPTRETMHPYPACCQPITCPASCPTGETMHPYPACCQPCSCAYQTGGDTQTTLWTTTNSTPSGAVTPANAYTCETLNQEAKFTETWTASSPECAISDPCPGRTYKKHRGVPGDIAPDCDTSPDRGTSACPCEGSDPRSCCIACTSTTDTTRTGVSPSGISLDLDNKWNCYATFERLIDTITHTPVPPCPTPTTSRRNELVCGAREVTCANACTDVAGMEVWDDCQQHDYDDGTSSYLKLKKTPRVCTSPCGGISHRCPSLDLSTCSTEYKKYYPCTCAGGDYPGMTETAAELDCKQDHGPSAILTATPNGTTLKCKCTYDDNPLQLCLNHNDVVIPDDVIEACNAAPHTSWDATNCVCVGYPDSSQNGQYTIKLCISPAAWPNSADLFANIKTNIVSDYDRDWVNLENNQNDAHQWGPVLKQIRCGAPGATSLMQHASVQTFNKLVNFNTSHIDSVSNAVYGLNECTDTKEITWNCN